MDDKNSFSHQNLVGVSTSSAFSKGQNQHQNFEKRLRQKTLPKLDHF
jgi:hypothetical protein